MQTELSTEDSKSSRRTKADEINDELLAHIARLEKCIAHICSMTGTAGVLELYNIKKFKVQ